LTLGTYFTRQGYFDLQWPLGIWPLLIRGHVSSVSLPAWPNF